MTIAIDDRCTACGACLITCPEGALVAAPRRPSVLARRCTDCLACVEVCPVDAIGPQTAGGSRHPIEVESYRIMSRRVDLSAWSGPEYEVVARMVHATADPSFATSARIGEEAVARAVAALRRGAPVVCDSKMVAAGIPSVTGAQCLLDEVPATAGQAPVGGEVAPGGAAPVGGIAGAGPPVPATRSAAAFRLAALRYPEDALWVVGNAPTALAALVQLAAAGRVCPAAVIGLPVGYVGAAWWKERLWQSALGPRSITNEGERGGSPVAAAVVNALHRLARDQV
ncbi:MAG TPA: precorrin-8X methylmutase [Acidimicrobiales bacterium]|nr:precorrin-8X methylmutase [Acidimicrobiales bacterium]